MNNLRYNNYLTQGYVVFENNTCLWWLRFLKAGFRHCYLLLPDPKSVDIIIEINALSNQIVVYRHNFLSFEDYLNYLHLQKHCHILPVQFLSAPPKCAPLGLFTCVEFVKRVIGIHNFFIQTPYQLYKILKKSQSSRKKVLTN